VTTGGLQAPDIVRRVLSIKLTLFRRISVEEKMDQQNELEGKASAIVNYLRDLVADTLKELFSGSWEGTGRALAQHMRGGAWLQPKGSIQGAIPNLEDAVIAQLIPQAWKLDDDVSAL